jgi:rhamnogalacturonyl hydrolase YesR
MTPPKEVNGSAVAGHLIFADWAQRTGDPRARRLVELAVRPAFDDQGRPLPAMPSHHEMSDAVFMACPLLVAAGRLSGEPKYMQMAVRHFEFMQKLCIRADGLYRHSPLCEAAWGRGNGFPMLGLALSLTELAAILEARTSSAALRDSANAAMNVMRPALHRHALALLPHQDATGAWRQVIDEPSAYREFTATCMIGFALERGIRRGWLDSATFASAADRAWQAANARIGADGVLLDVCTGTGKQRTLQDYFDREAVLGRDERGGGMALIFAVERGRTSP